VLDLAGSPVVGAHVEFVSSNPSVASISQTGVLYSLGPLGETVVQASASNEGSSGIFTATVQVTPVYASVELPPQPVTVGRMMSRQLQLTFRDLFGQPIRNPEITYVSHDPALVQTTVAGVVYSVGGLGQTTVTIHADTISRDVTVSVVNAQQHEWNFLTRIFGPTWGVAAGASGLFVATGGMRGSWKTMSVSDTIPAVGGGYGVALDANERYAYFTYSNGHPVRAIDLQTNAPAWDATSSGTLTPVAIVTRPGSQLLLVTLDPNFVAAVDTGTHAIVWSVTTPSAGTQHIALHPTQAKAWVNGANGIATEIDLQTRALRTIDVGTSLGGLLVSPSGKELYVINPAAKRLLVYDIATLGLLRQLDLGAECFGMAAAPNGSEVYVSCSVPNSVAILDGAATTLRKRIPLDGEVARLTVSPDGSTLIVSLGRHGIAFLR
jgi:DNA-binding beta-propeller fold protein YncE